MKKLISLTLSLILLLSLTTAAMAAPTSSAVEVTILPHNQDIILHGNSAENTFTVLVKNIGNSTLSQVVVTPRGNNTGNLSASKTIKIDKNATISFQFTIPYHEVGVYDFWVNVKNMQGNSGKWNLEYTSEKISVSVVNPPVENRLTDYIYASPYWTIYGENGRDINFTNLATKMKELKVGYQVIDLGFFDRDAITENMNAVKNGSLDPKFHRHLQPYISTMRTVHPEMKLIGGVNGSTQLHLRGQGLTGGTTRTQSINNIAMECKRLVDTYDLDGISLDFEPILERNQNDFLDLINAVRAAIGPDKELSMFMSLYDNGFGNIRTGSNFITTLANPLDCIVVGAYDGYYKESVWQTWGDGLAECIRDYKDDTRQCVLAFSRATSNQNCKLVVLGPGVYNDSEYHEQKIENTKHSAQAISTAINQGANVYGGGVWWFQGLINNPTEMNDYVAYWLNR